MDYSKITDDLFIGTTPTVPDYEHLRELGVRLVINMRWEFRPPPDLYDPPLHFLWQRTFDSPLIPIPMQALKRRARAALETIREGGKVYVHCAARRHRGVALGIGQGCCIFRHIGASAFYLTPLPEFANSIRRSDRHLTQA
jgi:hypothetical protein